MRRITTGFLAALLLAWCHIAGAALPSTGVWEIRVTGAPTNGGLFDPAVASAGTDYTLQDAPQVTYSDLVIGATTTQLTSAANPFTAAHVGNTINVTGGTGFTVGRYNVRSVAGSTATMDRAVGTAASTGGTGNLGGALDHVSTVLVAGAIGTGHVVFIKYGATPYSFGAGVAFSTTLGTFVFQGYDTTRAIDNTDGNRPTFRPTVNSITLLSISNNTAHVNAIVFDNPAGKTAVAGLVGGGLARISRCRFNGLTGSPITSSSTSVRVIGNEVTSCVSAADLISITGGQAVGNYIANNPGTGAGIRISAAGAYFRDNVVANGGGIGLSHSNAAIFDHCTAYANAAAGFDLHSEGEARSCISYGNGTYGYSQANASVITGRLVGCAAGANGTAATNGFRADLVTGLVTLSGNPFTNAAGGDFSLNGVAGAGASCRAIPVTLPGGTTTAYPDLGAAQHRSPGHAR